MHLVCLTIETVFKFLQICRSRTFLLSSGSAEFSDKIYFSLHMPNTAKSDLSEIFDYIQGRNL